METILSWCNLSIASATFGMTPNPCRRSNCSDGWYIISTLLIFPFTQIVIKLIFQFEFERNFKIEYNSAIEYTAALICSMRMTNGIYWKISNNIDKRSRITLIYQHAINTGKYSGFRILLGSLVYITNRAFWILKFIQIKIIQSTKFFEDCWMQEKLFEIDHKI